jgi:lysosomal acid lipase/cholesteryl ester hydrolase
MHYPKLAPAFKLVRAGFDVWLGNQRGTKHSLYPGHERLSPWSDKQFWEFSWNEFGYYDAPAFVDYVRHNTN